MEVLPVTNGPRQSLTVMLAGQSVDLSLWYQPLSAAWYVSLATRGGSSIARGRQVAPSVRLIRSRAFAGEIVAVPIALDDTSDLGNAPWETTHQLAYLTAAEVAALSWAV